MQFVEPQLDAHGPLGLTRYELLEKSRAELVAIIAELQELYKQQHEENMQLKLDQQRPKQEPATHHE